MEGSCVRHSSSGRGLQLVLPRLGEPANLTRRKGMDASDNNLFLFFLRAQRQRVGLSGFCL